MSRASRISPMSRMSVPTSPPRSPDADAAARVASSRMLIAQRLAGNGLHDPSVPLARKATVLLADWAWAASAAGGLEHPVRSTLALVGALARNSLPPLVRQRLAPLALRHPFALVGAAALAGALVAAARPWRWALRPAVMTGALGLATQVAARTTVQMVAQTVAQMVARSQSRSVPTSTPDAEPPR